MRPATDAADRGVIRVAYYTAQVLAIRFGRWYVHRVRVTRKGQVTVPKKLRERFGLTTETEVEFREDHGRLVLMKQNASDAVASIRGRVKQLPVGKDVDDYLRLTRGDE